MASRLNVRFSISLIVVTLLISSTAAFAQFSASRDRRPHQDVVEQIAAGTVDTSDAVHRWKRPFDDDIVVSELNVMRYVKASSYHRIE